MAEQKVIAAGSAQDTGNPVLDSLVNLFVPTAGAFSADGLRNIHQVLIELAKQEPGGLKVRGKEGELWLHSRYQDLARTEAPPPEDR